MLNKNKIKRQLIFSVY